MHTSPSTPRLLSAGLSSQSPLGLGRLNTTAQPKRRCSPPVGPLLSLRSLEANRRLFLFLSPNETHRLVPEKFGRSSPLPTCLWVSVRQSLGKRRLRAHRRRFARPPPILKPRWSKVRGRRERPKMYTMLRRSQRI